LGTDQPFFDFLLNELLHSALQIVREILHDRENLLNRRALDHFFDKVIVRLFGIRIDVDFGDPAKEIMNVSKNVLVGAHQEETQVIRLAFIETMQLECVFVPVGEINRSTLPSESHVKSTSVARRPGCSFRR